MSLNNGKRKTFDLTQFPETSPSIPEWMTKMRAAAQACISESDIQEIVQKQVERAKQGDAQAMKFVFEQVLGGAAFKGATFIQNNNSYGSDPTSPAKSKPGTQDRIAEMAARADRGLPLVQPGDATFEDPKERH